MPRISKPFLHRGWYITDIGGGRRKLCRESDGLKAAETALNRLKVERDQGGGELPPELTLAEAAALFLREVETDKGAEHKTFIFYKQNLQRLITRAGPRRLRTLTQQDGVNYKKWLKQEARTRPTGRRKGQTLGKLKEPEPLGPVTINHHLRAAKRLLNWCVNHEPPFLHRSPFRSIKLEEEQGRERLITEPEFQKLLDACTSDDQRDLLWAMRLTAARPEDVRGLTWGMVKWRQNCWVIRRHKTASTQKVKKPRVVPMVEAMETLLRNRQQRLGKPTDDKHVFLNDAGQPWDADDLSQWFSRLRERAGITEKDGENLVLYSNRHTRLTELAPNINPYLLQQVAGHTTFTMTLRYLHVPTDEVLDALREADKKRQSPDSSAASEK